MNIIFDIETTATAEQQKELYTSSKGTVLTQIKEIIETRFQNLKREIKWEIGEIIVCIGDPSVFQIKYSNITDDLKFKLSRSISERDIKYIIQKIWEVFYPGLDHPTI